jgi:hypothetical protein
MPITVAATITSTLRTTISVVGETLTIELQTFRFFAIARFMSFFGT